MSWRRLARGTLEAKSGSVRGSLPRSPDTSPNWGRALSPEIGRSRVRVGERFMQRALRAGGRRRGSVTQGCCEAPSRAVDAFVGFFVGTVVDGTSIGEMAQARTTVVATSRLAALSTHSSASSSEPHGWNVFGKQVPGRLPCATKVRVATSNLVGAANTFVGVFVGTVVNGTPSSASVCSNVGFVGVLERLRWRARSPNAGETPKAAKRAAFCKKWHCKPREAA